MCTGTACRVLASLAAAISVSSASAQSEGMPWRTDFQAARAEALQANKLLLVHFWTESCGPCKVLESRVYSQPQVAVAVTTEYVPVKVNAAQSPELAQALGVTRVPTDVIVTPQGQVVRSFVSPSTPMEYVGAVMQVANQHRTQAGGAYAAAAAQAPAQAVTSAGVLSVTPATADLARSTGVAPATSPASPSTSPFATPTAPVAASNPFAGGADRYAAQRAPVSAPTSQASPATATADTAPQLPPGSPELGFDGYCPVTMKNEWRWQKGDVRWGAIHQGRTYLFATETAQRAFLATPDQYSPVLSGVDPVVAVDQRKSVAGQREYAVQYPTSTGRFYLFSSQETLEKFWENPAAYAQGAERVAALSAEAPLVR